jgi:hypothetical protein
MILSKSVRDNTSDVLLKKSIAYCESIKASEIHNIACLDAEEFRIMYYIGEEPTRKMSAVILKI